MALQKNCARMGSLTATAAAPKSIGALVEAAAKEPPQSP